MTSDELSGSNLIDSMRNADKTMLVARLDSVHFKVGHILYHPGDDVQYAYFPRFNALSSYHVIMADGSSIETAITGREGAVGGIVSHGRLPAYARSCVMHGGEFYRIRCSDLEKLKEESGALRRLFNRYADCMVAQIFQSVACNAVHTVEQRAAKWLLAAMDRTGDRSIAMTQDQLGSLLGVGRTYASRVAGRLAKVGAIMTRRGRIVVMDRPLLEQTGCDCNSLVAQHFEAVLRGVYPCDSELNASQH